MALGIAAPADRRSRGSPLALRVWRALAVGCAMLISLYACGAEAPNASTVPEDLASGLAAVPDDPRELLKVDDAMRGYFAPRVKTRSTDSRALRQIVDAILQPDGLNFSYDAEATFSARDTFRLRRGNCVAFSFLVAAVTREFGFKATFQNVDTMPTWNRFGRIVASIQHVNVRVVANDGVFIVDLRPDTIPHTDGDGLQSVRDEREFAQFYNNVGFFYLVHGHSDEAMRYFTQATKIDPTYAGGWANVAGLHSQSGQLVAARDCYEKSLQLDRYGLVAMVGLVHILQQIGTPEDRRQAAKLERRAKSIEARNPYYQQYCAQLAREKGDLVAAEKLLKLAIDLKNDEPEFYQQWIEILQKMGRDGDARRITARLEKLETDLATQSHHVVR
jgi:tetratricopeptide (TPR) repeat protein